MRAGDKLGGIIGKGGIFPMIVNAVDTCEIHFNSSGEIVSEKTPLLVTYFFLAPLLYRIYCNLLEKYRTKYPEHSLSGSHN